MSLLSTDQRYVCHHNNSSRIGTRYFDDNWLLSGIGERKLAHVMDFIDSAIYLKEKGLAPKIGVLGTDESGSITALASVFTEPLLFDCAVAHVMSCTKLTLYIEPSDRLGLTPLSRHRAEVDQVDSERVRDIALPETVGVR